jgi:predicted kinase
MGAPGSGKSTWVKANSTGSEHVYCLDAIRVNRDLDIASFSYLSRVKAVKAVEGGQPLIADATHTFKAHRQVWLSLAQRLGLETKLVVFDTNLNSLLEVQKQREFPTARNVVVDHYRRIQLAKHQVKREGWGEIEVIKR